MSHFSFLLRSFYSFLFLVILSPDCGKLVAWCLLLIFLKNFSQLFRYEAGSSRWSSMNHGIKLLLSIFFLINYFKWLMVSLCSIKSSPHNLSIYFITFFNSYISSTVIFSFISFSSSFIVMLCLSVLSYVILVWTTCQACCLVLEASSSCHTLVAWCLWLAACRFCYQILFYSGWTSSRVRWR